MQFVAANEVFKQARQFIEGRTVEGGEHERNFDKAEKLLHELLNHNIGSDLILYTLGSLYLTKGQYGMAITLLSQVTQMKPAFGEAWNNLGLAFREYGDWDKGAFCVEQAMKTLDHPDIPTNMAGFCITRNMPEKALAYSEMALEKDPEHIKAKWHKALALLELQKWDEAWDYHETRLQGGANEIIALRNYHGEAQTPVWDGKTKARVVIHGEQGMGDEIMFASCVPDALATGAEIIFEPSPRMEKVFARAFPKAKVYGTDDVDGRRWINDLGKPDFKIALGSLPKLFRRSEKAFPGTPYLVPDADKRAWWSEKLQALGRRPNIGLAWQGGVMATRYDARSFHPGHYAPLFAHDANWISLQYDKTAQACVQEVREKQGVKLHHWPRAVEQYGPDGKPQDLDELIALVSKLDLVVSVCQTAIHVAGALGIPCLCLTPSQPSWRYGAGERTSMPWYRSVRLIRQAKGSDDWEPVIQEAADRVGQFIQQRKTA